MEQTVAPEAPLAALPQNLIPSPKQPLNENKELPAHIERHARKCTICRHPDREEIEQDYRNWFSAADIARRYDIDDSALHRHLDALGLLSRRRENLGIVLDRILERGPEKFISASEVIRAVKALACLSGESRWVEPPRTVIHIHTGDKCPEPLRDSGSARPA